MTQEQRRHIDGMDEAGLRRQYSSLSSEHHKEIMDYIQEKLDGLNVGEALVERGEEKISEFFQ